MELPSEHRDEGPRSPGRRKALKSAGKYAAGTTAAVTMLLSTSLATEAVAASGGYDPDGHVRRRLRRRWRRRWYS